MSRALAIGEAMVELAPAGGDPALYRLGFAGDTMNTAWHLRRRLPGDWDVDYLSCVGADEHSDRLLAFLRASGIGVDAIRRDPDRSLGLYMVSLERGERRFTYWRDRSAARGLADDPAHLARWMRSAALIYLSGVTCAILSPAARDALASALSCARAEGAAIAFDPNIRPRLWESMEALRAQIARFAALARWVLPSFDDEAAVFGDATPRATAARYLGLGATEVVVKNGAGPMALGVAGQDLRELAAQPTAEPVDSTGAGDSFNAAYLAARLSGGSVDDALAAGQALARRVIGHRGALGSE